MSRILLFGQKSGIWDILFKIYYMSNSIPAAKFQNFVDTLILEFDFFYLKRQGYRYYQGKNQVGLTSSSYINLIYNEIVDKVIK